jgi:hypothetical protein
VPVERRTLVSVTNGISQLSGGMILQMPYSCPILAIDCIYAVGSLNSCSVGLNTGHDLTSSESAVAGDGRCTGSDLTFSGRVTVLMSSSGASCGVLPDAFFPEIPGSSGSEEDEEWARRAFMALDLDFRGALPGRSVPGCMIGSLSVKIGRLTGTAPWTGIERLEMTVAGDDLRGSLENGEGEPIPAALILVRETILCSGVWGCAVSPRELLLAMAMAGVWVCVRGPRWRMERGENWEEAGRGDGTDAYKRHT